MRDSAEGFKATEQLKILSNKYLYGASYNGSIRMITPSRDGKTLYVLFDADKHGGYFVDTHDTYIFMRKLQANCPRDKHTIVTRLTKIIYAELCCDL